MSDSYKGFDPKYDDSKETNTILFGKSIKKPDGSSYRKVELLIDEDVSYLSEKNTETISEPVGFSILDDIILFKTPGGQQKIHCWLMESTSGKWFQAIRLSRRTCKGVYGSQEITLQFNAVLALREYLNNLFVVDSDIKTRIPIVSRKVDEDNTLKMMSESEFIELIRANINSTNDFYKLLSIQKMELSIEQLERIINGEFTNELEIQLFLKDNIWMFGNDYVHVAENGRINPQNILDMIPRNFESFIDIIEVKLPTEKLFNFDPGHKNYYSSAPLTKAVAQTQNYIFELEKKTTDEMYQEDNNIKVIRPNGIVLYGSHEPLSGEEQQYLRILNSSYHNLQIITYQQLLEKAKNTLRVWLEKDG